MLRKGIDLSVDYLWYAHKKQRQLLTDGLIQNFTTEMFHSQFSIADTAYHPQMLTLFTMPSTSVPEGWMLRLQKIGNNYRK